MKSHKTFYTLVRNFFYPKIIKLGRISIRFLSLVARSQNASSGPINLSKIHKILVIKLDNIGDFILVTPFLRELRRNFPDKWITLATSNCSRELASRCPYVDEVQAIPINVTGLWSILKTCSQHCKFGNKLRHQGFDLAINVRWDSDYYHAWLLMYRTHATWRITHSETVYELKEKHDQHFDAFYTQVRSSKKIQHEVLQNLDLITFLGGKIENEELELWVDDQDRKWASEFLGREEILTIFIGFSASKNHKRWGIEKFIQVANSLVTSFGCKVILSGTPQDSNLLKSVKSHCHSRIKFLCDSNLWKIVAMIEKCHLVLCNDSAPAHIAAAVKTPVVTINPFAPETLEPWSDYSPLRFSPWKIPSARVHPPKPTEDRENIPSDASKNPILDISVDAVENVTTDLLRNLSLLPKNKG